MSQATILAPLVLAVVLALSGAAKLRDPASVDEAFTQLRVPSVLDRPWLRRSVAWAELALAAALLVLPAPLSVGAALASLALFSVYTVLIARAWRAPEAASCNCFGALTTGRVSGWTVVRNVVLVAFSLAALADAVGSGPALLRLADASVLAWVAGAAAVGLLVFSVVHEPDAAPAAPQAPVLPVDEDEEYVRLPIPYTRVTDASGQKVPLRQLSSGRAQLLAWVSTTCGSCEAVIVRLEEWQRAMPEVEVRPVVVTPGSLDERLPSLRGQVLVDDERALSVFGSYGTPTAVLLGADGLIAGGPVTGSDAVLDLVEGMVEQLADMRAAAEPETVPASHHS